MNKLVPRAERRVCYPHIPSMRHEYVDADEYDRLYVAYRAIAKPTPVQDGGQK